VLRKKLANGKKLEPKIEVLCGLPALTIRLKYRATAIR